MLGLLLCPLVHPANASTPTVFTAYKSQHPVTLDGVVEPGEWSDTPMIQEPTSGMTVAFKQNGTGLLFMLSWPNSPPCSDQYCYGGIELGNLNNTGEMGTLSTPTVMILLSPSFQGVDEFISTGDATPGTVESYGYKTQSVCGFKMAGGNYTAECYRPFKLANASPYDPFPTLVAGSPIEIAFAVGEFNQPGNHDATTMSQYELKLSNQTYTQTATSSSSSSSTTSSRSTASTPSTSSSTASITQAPSTFSTSLSSSSSLAISSSSTTQSSSTSSPVSAALSANYYAEELLVLITGFTVIVTLVLRRYEET